MASSQQDQAGSQPSRVPPRQPKFVKDAPDPKPKNLVIRPPGDFLWVDYQDDKSQGRELSRSKQAFVRTRHHRMRREKQLQQLKSPSDSCPTPTPSHAPIAKSTKNTRRIPVSKDKDETQSTQKRCPVQQSSLIVNSIEPSVLDGGPALAVAINQNPNIYFHHYKIHSSRACFPLCSSGVVLWFWQKALEDPALMQIKLSISASHRAAILESCGAPPDMIRKPAQDALRLRVGTIKSVQELLQNKNKIYADSTIFVISHLIVAEGMEGNVEAVEAHINGLEKIVAGAGGMEVIDYGILSMVYRVFKESAFFKLNCRFTKLSKVNKLGTGFFNSTWSKDIPPMFKSIISLFQQLVTYYESLDIVFAEPMSVENDCLLFLGYRLLALPYQCSLSPFQETIRLTILSYASVRVWSFYGMPCLEALVETLRESLYDSLHIIRSTATDLLVWVLFIGSLASRGMRCHSWFLTRLVDAADQLLLDGWDSAVPILEKFFFVCRDKDEPARELWTAAFR
ncbi:uncharacterized protein N7469_006823 [Penicillium citrinum]|uniref:Uncharacterized protein n=1 Tax=Penicillium citrinum TaxID=5077 RepID=A0A9W9TL20_PENCI|nr:uncharacterized protein N7469_006823 [Penicillium citrinum]KAJ5226817.1 hypothetical protein N7469_006823 [Penicillium citrinum]